MPPRRRTRDLYPSASWRYLSKCKFSGRPGISSFSVRDLPGPCPRPAQRAGGQMARVIMGLPVPTRSVPPENLSLGSPHSSVIRMQAPAYAGCSPASRGRVHCCRTGGDGGGVFLGFLPLCLDRPFTPPSTAAEEFARRTPVRTLRRPPQHRKRHRRPVYERAYHRP